MGGSEYQVKCIIERLLSLKKYEIYYLARHIDPAFKTNEYKTFQVSNARGIRRFGEFFDAPKLIKLLNKIKPNVIYQRVGCGYTGVAAYYARNNECKLVWHVAHDMDLLPFESKFTRSIIFRYIEKKVLDYGIVHADDIIVQTLQQGKLLQQYYGKIPTAVIPNAHPFPEEEIVKNSPVKIVWIANLLPWKRPEVFIKLAKDLQDIKDLQFMMIGRPPRDLRWYANFLKEIAKLDNLKYLGKQTQEEVNAVLASAHIFVNTSAYEGFANTFIQAWMRKVPVVSLSVNPDNVFNDSRVGFFSGSFEKMKDDVIRLIQQPNLRQEIGETARTYAFENYSMKNIRKIMEVIDR